MQRPFQAIVVAVIHFILEWNESGYTTLENLFVYFVAVKEPLQQILLVFFFPQESAKRTLNPVIQPCSKWMYTSRNSTTPDKLINWREVFKHSCVVCGHFYSILNRKTINVLKVIWSIGKGSEIFRENSHLFDFHLQVYYVCIVTWKLFTWNVLSICRIWSLNMIIIFVFATRQKLHS